MRIPDDSQSAGDRLDVVGYTLNQTDGAVGLRVGSMIYCLTAVTSLRR